MVDIMYMQLTISNHKHCVRCEIFNVQLPSDDRVKYHNHIVPYGIFNTNLFDEIFLRPFIHFGNFNLKIICWDTSNRFENI